LIRSLNGNEGEVFMAIKKYKALITGTHALTGLYIEAGKEYDIEESLAGQEIFQIVRAGFKPAPTGTINTGAGSPRPQRKNVGAGLALPEKEDK
jgi:hypothetical protein